MMRDQLAAMEKGLGGMQAKAQGSYKELQTMQMKVTARVWLSYILSELLFPVWTVENIRTLNVKKLNSQHSLGVKAQQRAD